MLCEICGKNEAVIDLTKVEDNEMTIVHLCKTCAVAEGVAPPDPEASPLVDFLAQMGGSAPTLKGSGADSTPCEFCGLSLKEFRKTGRLGCPHCYVTFEDHLERLLRRIHGSVHHVGKVYLPVNPSASDLERKLHALRQRLERAVEAEDFERAAVIRDEIRGLEVTQT